MTCNINVTFIYLYCILVVYKGYLYVFGGYNGLHDLHFRDIFRFDPGMFLQLYFVICISSYALMVL